MFISPERLDDPDFIDRANRTYLFGMFAEECGANGDMAREGRVPMARLYVQGVPAVRDLDVLVWNPDEGAPVFGDNPTLVVDRPPKGPDHIGSLHLGMGASASPSPASTWMAVSPCSTMTAVRWRGWTGNAPAPRTRTWRDSRPRRSAPARSRP